ncbi:MAG: hypothetical protein R2697_17085 [Ilumatobacteraceae bacterium]
MANIQTSPTVMSAGATKSRSHSSKPVVKTQLKAAIAVIAAPPTVMTDRRIAAP